MKKSNSSFAYFGLVFTSFATLVTLDAFFPRAALAISEASYAVDYSQKVMSFYSSASGVQGHFVGLDGVSIEYKKFEIQDEEAAIVISSGRTESFIKYAEVIYDLTHSGRKFSVYALDHRGQGFSGRMTPNPQVGYVSEFQDYVSDFKYFIDHVVNGSMKHTHLYVLSHSMGAAIATRYVQEYPGVIEKLVVSSPMFQLKLLSNSEEERFKDPKTQSIYRSLYEEAALGETAFASNVLGQGMQYAPGQDDLNPNQSRNEGIVTHSDARWNSSQQNKVDFPELRLGGASFGFVWQSILATRLIQNEASSIRIPVLMLKAEPKNELVVESEGQDRFFSRLPKGCRISKQCRKVVVSGAWHEILMEKDSMRDLAFKEIFDFLK